MKVKHYGERWLYLWPQFFVNQCVLRKTSIDSGCRLSADNSRNQCNNSLEAIKADHKENVCDYVMEKLIGRRDIILFLMFYVMMIIML